ncbi:TPA: KpsF/GutQ family sugar-phosphate isomerase [Acinetobacter baumannii]|jgi:arabinose-5-phosphate isomerase|uniref:Arabinose 5-phosphate isomerase n=14 Tax=Acinetobacter baumannii TaxID=470 RepID=A0A059ZSQ4_ACIBA|nr:MULTISPECIES: KpsF/GutQ family sugar-phosphate isomerase [Acinetobacter]ADX91837.1 sugar phosphate isomerase [Acinetobacter baumannii TCDC-AB0715]AHX28210.1 D-arabinose 5-phosphate isomerase [Acinetobacter baumannii AC12]AHX64238.1 D-arabinose 5-phosphate isomerase [Acinetobacter baumannii AC30]EMT88128.1 KpsF/GutQ family protein [Acinetobacter baumannii ABNIH5]ETY70031.1 D-arabinose 5-phosphate isomerase [Acinetobacter baumannii MDR_MMC4]EXB11897.1 sugar isomerase, KpsF/GutQ family protei
MPNPTDFQSSALATLRIEQQAIDVLATQIDDRFNRACEILLQCKGRVVITGMGKSGHIGRKMAATFASTGTPSFFMHPGEAGHGDLGMLVRGDVLIAISNSGKSDEIMMLMPLIKHLGVPLITISRDDKGPMPQNADIALTLGESDEACPLGLAPTSSTTATLVLGDALAVALLEARGFTADDFARSHPAGALGKRLLLHVKHLMHTGDELPKVSPNTPMNQVLYEISNKRLGLTTIVDEQDHLLGIFTDGDLRRLIDKQQGFDVNLPVSEVMTKKPSTISQEARAVEALQQLNQKKISQFVVVDDQNKVIGVISMHDLIQAGVN